jgi:hypothetical protein
MMNSWTNPVDFAARMSLGPAKQTPLELHKIPLVRLTLSLSLSLSAIENKYEA